MKLELEQVISEFLQTLIYKEESIAENFICGAGDKPEGLTSIIISCDHPMDSRAKVRGRNQNVQVVSTGQIIFIYKLQEGDDILEDAEERNDKIPDYANDQMIKDETLGNRLNGSFIPTRLIGGMYELKNTEGVFFHVSVMNWQYEGAWISPVME